MITIYNRCKAATSEEMTIGVNECEKEKYFALE